MSRSLKDQTANALLWSSVDKVFTQICYAVTGIVLANILMPEDFGAIAVIGVFTAFATIFIDSGFSMALIQKKVTTREDYSTILFFNIGLSSLLYVILFFSAPAIAWYFEDERLVSLSRVMFLSFIFLSLSLVQSSMLMKQMNLKKLAIVNVVSLLFSSLMALWLVFAGFGVWALVAQTLSYSFIRTLVLWLWGRWLPLAVFSKESFRSIFRVGHNILLTAFVRTFFQNIYALIIGGKYTMAELGYYNQADKWSRMGTAALSQSVGNAAFPALASIQDDKERMRNVFGKLNRMISYLTFPAIIWLIVMAEVIFHCLFGTKWDASILLFRLLVFKGVFFVFTSLLNNYIMATGKTRTIFILEIIRDVAALLAIVFTIRVSIPALVIGQVVVEVMHYIITSIVAARQTGYSLRRQLADMAPYAAIALLISLLLIAYGYWINNVYVLAVVQGVSAVAIYLLVNRMLDSKIQKEIFGMIRGKREV